MQLAAAILFFYVFGIAAIALTYYIASICLHYWQEKKKKPEEKQEQ
jgi:hypothetical protein